MSLSSAMRDRLLVAMRSREAAHTIADAIDSSGSGPAAVVAALGAPAAPTALVVTATNVAASNFTAALPAEPTKAEIDVGIDTVVLAIETALNLKADNTDVETLRTELTTKLTTIHTKIDAILTALKNADMMDT